MSRSNRSEMYALLAELLATPPDWVSQPGREWPLFDLLTHLVPEFAAAHRHLDLLAGIPCESTVLRNERYASLFASGRPHFWLYESAAKTGKILGPQTFNMAQLYRSAGLEADGAELPDHISLELTFLSYLAGRDDHMACQETERQFLEFHGTWMVDLGLALKRSGDPVYAPIGLLLADWMTEQMHHEIRNRQNTSPNPFIPMILNPDECTLCGFCAQICPTRALKVLEDHKETILALNIAECIHCGKCEKVCDFKVLTMVSAPADQKNLRLRISPLISCKKCGQFIASQAELNFIRSQIGESSWQHLCLDCRVTLYV